MCIRDSVRSVVEIVIVVNEIYLHACGLQGGNLYNKRMVSIINDYIHSTEADNFVELIAPLVNTTVFRHKGAHFITFFLNALRNFSASERLFGFGGVGGYLCLLYTSRCV